MAGYGVDADGQADPGSIILHDSNDSLRGDKFVVAESVAEPTELWQDGKRLVMSRRLIRLKGAPIRKDGRIAFLETIFTFSPKVGD